MIEAWSDKCNPRCAVALRALAATRKMQRTARSFAASLTKGVRLFYVFFDKLLKAAFFLFYLGDWKTSCSTH
jgi:hypothetical protein